MEDKKLDNWAEVNKKVESSKIIRIGWKKILGESLTIRIHRLRNKGHNSDEVFSILVRNPSILKYCRVNPLHASRVLENLRTSVCARFGESKTAAKIREEIN